MTVFPEILIAPREDHNFEICEDCLVEPFGVVIKKGSVTDLTSSPRWLWWLIPPHGDSKRASILHDYMIRDGGYDAREADEIYLYFLLKFVPRWQALLMYVSISTFTKKRRKHENSI